MLSKNTDKLYGIGIGTRVQMCFVVFVFVYFISFFFWGVISCLLRGPRRKYKSEDKPDVMGEIQLANS